LPSDSNQHKTMIFVSAFYIVRWLIRSCLLPVLQLQWN